jgi:hypothetical protein
MSKRLRVGVPYMCVSWVAGFMATVCDQISLARREVNHFHLLQATVS